MKKALIDRLTIHVEDAGAEESKVCLKEIESLSEDDLQITSVKRFSFEGDELCFAHEE